MSAPVTPGVDPVEIIDNAPIERLRTELEKFVHNPSWESPTVIQITPGVAVQLVRFADFDGLGASVEILARSDIVDTSPLVTLGDSSETVAKMQWVNGEVTDEQKKAAADLSTRGLEVPTIAPICALVQGVLAGLPDYDCWIENDDGASQTVTFNYAFEVDPNGVVVQDPSMPYDQGRENPFDVNAHVFVTGLELTYEVEDLPAEHLADHWNDRAERTVEDSVNAPTASQTDTEVGDVFYNTQTDEYCWVIAFDPVLGAILQYEDGTFWDQQLRSNGVPAGPYECRELPDDYDQPIPDPDNPCDVENHAFGVTRPNSYRDVDQRVCEECGLSTGTLMEMYGQWPLTHVEFECIGCDTTGKGKDLITDARLEGTAICEGCWDPSLTPLENFEKYSDDSGS